MMNKQEAEKLAEPVVKEVLHPSMNIISLFAAYIRTEADFGQIIS